MKYLYDDEPDDDYPDEIYELDEDKFFELYEKMVKND